MSDRFFRDGGPHDFRETSPGKYEASIKIEPDVHGMLARACPDEHCAPGYFKVKPGTGLPSPTLTFCPYCGHPDAPRAFPSKAQIEYGKAVVIEEAKQGLNELIRKAMGLDASGQRTFGGGLLQMTMQLKPVPRQPVLQPAEEELRRELVCPHCGLVHAVFGLASTCPDCGRNILTTHVNEELTVLRKILDVIPDRLKTLGPRVAARDVENALEDVVSTFEAVMKFITRRVLLSRGNTRDEVDEIFKSRVRNEYQSVSRGAALHAHLLGREMTACLESAQAEALTRIFEKRHPITHNLGVVDRKYMRKAATGELEGTEVRVTPEEVHKAIALVQHIIDSACADLLDAQTVTTVGPVVPPRGDSHVPATEADVFDALSPAARAIAKYLVTHSEFGHDRDPVVALPDLESILQVPFSELLAGAKQLEDADLLWIHDPVPNSRNEIGPKATLFELCDRLWMGWDVRKDALLLAQNAVQKGVLIVPEEAEAHNWSPRRMNPAVLYLHESGVQDDCYAHPFVAYRIHDCEALRTFIAKSDTVGSECPR